MNYKENAEETSIENLFSLIEIKKNLPQDNRSQQEFENFFRLKEKFLKLKKENSLIDYSERCVMFFQRKVKDKLQE